MISCLDMLQPPNACPKNAANVNESMDMIQPPVSFTQIRYMLKNVTDKYSWVAPPETEQRPLFLADDVERIGFLVTIYVLLEQFLLAKGRQQQRRWLCYRAVFPSPILDYDTYCYPLVLLHGNRCVASANNT